jgi:hypothetical protein
MWLSGRKRSVYSSQAITELRNFLDSNNTVVPTFRMQYYQLRCFPIFPLKALDLSKLRLKLEAACIKLCTVLIRDTSVGVATAYWLYGRRVGARVLVGDEIFSFRFRPDQFLVPPTLISNEYRDKAAGPWTTNLKLFPRIYTFTPPYVSMVYCLINLAQGIRYLSTSRVLWIICCETQGRKTKEITFLTSYVQLTVELFWR